MKTFQHVGAAVVAALVLLAAARASADEAPALGLSLDGYVAPAFDNTVTATTPGAPKRQSRGMIGFATLANLGSFAAGGVVDGFPGIFGDGRLTVGGMAGWQPEVGRHRYQVLGEVGAERFSDVGGTFFNSPSTHETWLDYVGARLGTSESFGAGRHFELGAWMFVRKDLGEATVSSTGGNILGGESVPTQYHLGGYTAGAALRIGLRFDQRRAPAIDPTELASGP
jgi:hypothetical protein